MNAKNITFNPGCNYDRSKKNFNQKVVKIGFNDSKVAETIKNF